MVGKGGEEMNRIEIIRPMLGICWMVVCAERDATDEEILKVCNAENPSGTTHGWGRVVREDTELTNLEAENIRPVVCLEDENRLHLIISC
jgi:hypothetical protein